MDKKILDELIAIKKALENVVTKDDLKDELAKYATKDDLKDELAKYATKDDLKLMWDELLEKLDGADKMQMAIFETLDKVKEDKVNINLLKKRIERLEEKAFI